MLQRAEALAPVEGRIDHDFAETACAPASSRPVSPAISIGRRMRRLHECQSAAISSRSEATSSGTHRFAVVMVQFQRYGHAAVGMFDRPGRDAREALCRQRHRNRQSAAKHRLHHRTMAVDRPACGVAFEAELVRQPVRVEPHPETRPLRHSVHVLTLIGCREHCHVSLPCSLQSPHSVVRCPEFARLFSSCCFSFSCLAVTRGRIAVVYPNLLNRNGESKLTQSRGY